MGVPGVRAAQRRPGQAALVRVAGPAAPPRRRLPAGPPRDDRARAPPGQPDPEGVRPRPRRPRPVRLASSCDTSPPCPSLISLRPFPLWSSLSSCPLPSSCRLFSSFPFMSTSFLHFPSFHVPALTSRPILMFLSSRVLSLCPFLYVPFLISSSILTSSSLLPLSLFVCSAFVPFVHHVLFPHVFFPPVPVPSHFPQCPYKLPFGYLE